MKTPKPDLRDYLPTLIAAIVTAGLLPCAFYGIGIVLTGDIGGPLNIIAIPFINLLVSSAIICLVLFPTTLIFIRRSLFSTLYSDESQKMWILIASFTISAVIILASCSFILWFNLYIIPISPTSSDVEPPTFGLFRFIICGGFPLLAALPLYVLFLFLFRNNTRLAKR